MLRKDISDSAHLLCISDLCWGKTATVFTQCSVIHYSGSQPILVGAPSYIQQQLRTLTRIILKVSDLQAHNEAHHNALWACRLAIFRRYIFKPLDYYWQFNDMPKRCMHPRLGTTALLHFLSFPPCNLVASRCQTISHWHPPRVITFFFAPADSCLAMRGQYSSFILYILFLIYCS